jgi:hypothetical protein
MKIVIYHGIEWGSLVERGWVTHEVSEPFNGVRMATMVYVPRGYWRM